MRRVLLLVAMLLALGATASTSAAPTSDAVRFAAVGDFGASANTASVLNGINAQGSDLTVALGDFSYGTTGAEETWCDFVKSRLGAKHPFELISGNHESNGLNGNVNDFSACLPNQLPGLVGTYGRQYYVDVPQERPLVRFLLASPGLTYPTQGGGQAQWTYPAGSARYQWVAQTIDQARAQGIPWVVVGIHKPCLSVGVYPCESGADLNALLVEKRVDLVLSGHEHLYQRSKQLGLSAGCASLAVGSFNPQCVVDADDNMTKGAGTVFATIGTGGVGLRDVNAADPEAGYFAALSGANQQPSYGFGDVSLTRKRLALRFVPGSGTFSDAFAITVDDTPPPPNQDPSASFTADVRDLTATFDATGSRDPDGAVVSYAWDFGDGTSGSGATATRTYATPGSRTVRLTVTDDDGASATTTREVVVTSPPPASLLARDAFERQVGGGWGLADVGGAWTVSGGGATRFRVTDGAGTLQVPSSTSLVADLGSARSSSTRVDTEFSVDKLAEGTYVAVVGRRTSASGYYAGRLALKANGQGTLYLVRGSSVSLGSVVPGFAFAPGVRYRLAVQVTGTSPTTVSAKVWRASDPEPSAWQRTGTDSGTGLQEAGTPGVFSYLPGAASASAPVTVSFHDLTVTDPR
ncbi:hypothetical protein GCM10028771_28490 [Nocardioides marmoraquaticus]